MAIKQVGLVPTMLSASRRKSHSIRTARRSGQSILGVIALTLLIEASCPAKAASPDGQVTWALAISQRDMAMPPYNCVQATTEVLNHVGHVREALKGSRVGM